MEGPVRSSVLSRMLSRGGAATSAPSPGSSTHASELTCNPYSSNSPTREPDAERSSYLRVKIDGEEGDADFAKCAAIIAKTILARQSYKSIDKGQAEELMHEEQLQEMPLNAPKDMTADTPLQHTKQRRRSTQLPGHEEPLDLTAAPSDGDDDDDDDTTNHDADETRASMMEEGEEEGGSATKFSSSSTNGGKVGGRRGLHITYQEGVYRVTDMRTSIIPWEQYVKDICLVYAAIENGPCLSTARARLTSMAEKFQLYLLLNTEVESSYDASSKGGGVYARGTKVDNGLNMKTNVSASTFLDFVVRTATEAPRTPLYTSKTGKTVTLMGYLEAAGIHSPEELTVEGLGLHPSLFRNKYIPHDVYDRHLNRAGTVGQRLMQAVFATHGPNNGDLCGALIRSELEQREFRQKQIITTEMTLEVYGHHPDEVERLAAWVHRQGFNNFKRNMWSIMIPRRAPPDGPNTLENKVVTVGDQLRHIFLPLMMATLYPADRKWAPVAQLLRQTGSLCIHTEPVIRTENLSPHPINPDNIAITPDKVCSDYYFFYYVWANLASLNALRRRLGLNTIQFSPFVLEPTSAFDQLVAGFLLGDVVHHVTSLRKSWIMQYLYMMCRIGIVLSPLRDNALHTPYFEHPITTYFRQGMRVSMATSDPLYFHHRSEQPLVEEYATLMKVHNLQPMDLCELARNSVLNSNFPLELKREWLGEHFSPLGSSGNDVSRSSVCNHRLDFRHESLLEEETLLNLVLATAAKQGETPMVVGNIPIAASLQLPEVVAQSRRQRRINYTDRRIVYPRIDVYGLDSTHIRAKESVETLRHVMALRNKYTNTRVVDVCVEDVFAHASDFEEDMYEYNSYYGVCLLSRVGTSPEWPAFIPPVQDFIHDVNTVRRAVSSRELTKLAVHRLHVLERKFLLHISINISNEAGKQADKEWNNRDYLTAHKVDTNVRIDAGHNARTLLEFFVDKVLNHGEDVVFEEDNQPITLRQLLRRYDINVSQITVDELNHQIDAHPDLRRIFLSPFNFMQGRYFAELTKRTLTLYQEDAYNFAENRLALQGESEQEWVELAHWFDRYGMASSQSRWMVSFPRSYRRLKQQGVVRDFGQFLDNLFRPLWEISLHPARDTKFHYFLAHVSGFDCYDDETWFDVPLSVMYPHDWRSQQNPPYNLYLYYMWANITSLNEFRASRGLGTFTFRPQCGEHGGVDHLIGGFLLCNGISHGVTLAKHPVMEYMYYLTQLGVAMSPLSNTASACAYLENPFPIFFHRGLNVSLGTNQPLYFHFTREPLVEEYSIAAKLWRFEFNDLSEIARNSVLQSGFPPSWKHKALGPLYQLHSTLGNDVRRSRVSDIRVAYRYEVYHTELNYLDAQLSTTHRMPRAMTLLEEELAQYEAALRNRCVAELIATSVPANKDAVEEARLRKEKEAEANISLESRCATARSDIATLEQEIHRIQALSTQARTQNVQMAMAINRIRTYLQNERFSILGNLGENAAESTAAASPLSPREMTRKLNNSSGENSVTGRGFLSAPGTARHSSVVVGGGGDADEKGSSVGDEDERVLELSKTSGYEGKEGGALRVPDLAHAARTNSSSNASHPLQLEEEDEEGDDDDGVAKEEEEDEERNGSSSTGSQVGVVVGELTHQGYPDIVEEEVEAATADDAAPATTSSAIHEDVVADDGEKKCDQNDGDAVVEMGSAHTAGSADDEPQEVPDCEEEAAQMNRDVDGSAPLQQHSSSNHSNSNSNSAVVKSNASLPASDAHDQQPTSPPKEVENVADEPSNNHHENGEEEEQQHVEEMPTSTPSE